MIASHHKHITQSRPGQTRQAGISYNNKYSEKCVRDMFSEKVKYFYGFLLRKRAEYMHFVNAFSQ